MSTFLSLLLFFSLVTPSHPQPQSPKGIFIDCGATVPSVIDGRKWLPDADFISTGTPRNITIPDVVPILSTLRSFPLGSSPRRKICYSVPVYRTGKYMVRTTYFYGGINGRDLPPPVFDQIVDGTFWSVVNSTEDYAREMSSYYEGVFVAGGKKMTVCIAANTYTDSDPFISALELVLLNDSVYNSTDFEKFGLSLVARHIFGYAGPIIRYPDDQFDRYWQPFGENNPTAESIRSISVSGFWNLPPLKIFETELTKSQPQRIEFQWPPAALPNSTYYIALYFADNGYALSGNARVFNVSINGMTYYSNLNATPAGAAVFATRWPLAGLTNITLTPAAGFDIAPLINAGEVFNVLLLGGKTLTRDVIALELVRSNFQNSPLDWNGDPCLPRQYSWTGVTCSEGPQIRVISLNLSSMGLSGSLSPNIANLTALISISLGNNSLSGYIPDLSPLKRLKMLHLEDNQFSGEIPQSLDGIDSLREIFLQNNNLTGQVPNSLMGKPGLNLKILPGNHFSSPAPS